MKPISVMVLTASLSVLPSLADAQSSTDTTAASRVRTTDGFIAGLTLPSGVRAFRGVPFAAAPVRELRWQPPQRAQPWAGVRAADRFAAQCMQARIYSDMVFRNAGVSEDCLYLNVWMPAGASATVALPVLVYFYGGGFQAGDGSEPRYDGESMARRGIVVVTTSYRLGVFGFFAHPELTRESPHHASGNYAFLDQVAALRWVHDNIAAFGGNPGRVTIAGESAGSFSVSALMASPLSREYISAAVGESGSLLSETRSSTPLADAEREGVRFATDVGASSLAGLRAMSAMELLAATTRSGAARFGSDIDGWFLPESPATIYAAGRQARVPLLAGWNSEESSARALSQTPITPESLHGILLTIFGAQAADAERVYPLATADEALQSATNLASDRFIAYSTWKWLEEHGRTSGKPVYRYFYSHARPAAVAGPSQSAPPPRGAVHSAEIEYAMGNLASNNAFAWSGDDYRVSNTMQAYFENFIKTGNPNGDGLPNWPVGLVDSSGRVMHMRIDVNSRAEPEDRARYLFLERFYGQSRK